MLFPQFPLQRKTNGVFVCVHTALLIIFLQERIPDQKQGMGSLLEQHCEFHGISLIFLCPLPSWLGSTWGRAAKPPALESTLSALVQLSHLSRLEAPHLLMTGTMNTQQQLLPDSSCLLFRMEDFCTGRFDTFYLSSLCASIQVTWAQARSQRTWEDIQ